MNADNKKLLIRVHPCSSVAIYSFLNATTARGGSVMAMECGRWCLGMGCEPMMMESYIVMQLPRKQNIQPRMNTDERG
jgi:hypothetical protein